MGRVSGRRGQVALGTLVIVLCLGGLWWVYRPSFPGTVETKAPPRVPLLHDAHATVDLHVPQQDRVLRASITCRGRVRRATGFWHANASEACDALASTRGALLADPGCGRLSARRVQLLVTGRFGRRRLTHRSERGGCTREAQWLAVDVLVAPVVLPDQKLVPANTG